MVFAATLACNSWGFKPASCATGVVGGAVTLVSDQSGGYCKQANWSVAPSSTGTVISVINGCRGTFSVTAPIVPQIPVYAILTTTGTLAQVTSLSGQAPFSVHLSALNPKPNTCSFNQTAWRAAGMHNICAFDKAAFSVITTPLAQDFMGGAVTANNACFVMPPNGAQYDVNTLKIIKELASCVASQSQQSPTAYLTDYNWDFGDPGTPFDQVKGFNAAHVYYKPGTYSASLNGSIVKVVVTPNTRTTVLINTQADMNALAAVGTQKKLSNRMIVIASGKSFNVPSTIVLYSGDWLTSTGTPPTLSSTTGATIFGFPYHVGEILIEKVKIQNASEISLISAVDGPIQDIVFKDIQFDMINKGFDIGGYGILIQNVGSALPWQDVHLKSNFELSTPNVLALYGNNFFVPASAGDGEPGMRQNGGQLASFIGNNIGGYIGKYDDVSMRGVQDVYFGSNNVRGGVINTQDGDSQDPQPGGILVNAVFENNQLDNCSFELGGGTYNTRVTGNTARYHKINSTPDPYFVLYPPEQSHLMQLGGSAFGLSSTNLLVNNNTLIEGDVRVGVGGELIRIGGSVVNGLLKNNLLWTAQVVPFEGSPLPTMTGNTFYLKKLTDLPSSPGNTVQLNTAYTPTGI